MYAITRQVLSSFMLPTATKRERTMLKISVIENKVIHLIDEKKNYQCGWWLIWALTGVLYGNDFPKLKYTPWRLPKF